MQGDFETLHTHYLDPPEPKVWGYDWKENEIYTGDRYYDIGKDKVLEEDIEEYLKALYLKEPPVTRINAYDWKGNKTDAESAYYFLNGDYIGEDDIEEYLKEVHLVDPVRIAGE